MLRDSAAIGNCSKLIVVHMHYALGIIYIIYVLGENIMVGRHLYAMFYGIAYNMVLLNTE